MLIILIQYDRILYNTIEYYRFLLYNNLGGMTVKKVLLPIFLVICLVFLSSCSIVTEGVKSITNSLSSVDDEYAHEADAEKLIASTTYYNSFLGVAYTVPSGWWIYGEYPDNFSTAQETTTSEATFDVYIDDGYSYLDLISFANLQYSTRDNHIGMVIYAEKDDGIETLDAFIIEHVDYMLLPYDDDTYSLEGEGQEMIHGRLFEWRDFKVYRSDSPYNIITYSCEVNGGYYLTIEANYWPKNKKAPQSIRKFIEEGLGFI